MGWNSYGRSYKEPLGFEFLFGVPLWQALRISKLDDSGYSHAKTVAYDLYWV